MAFRYPQLYKMIQWVTLSIALLAFIMPGLVTRVELWLSIVLILFLGIPHGATDHILFKYLDIKILGSKSMIRFYAIYLMIGLLYGIIWWLIPTLALVIFLGISMYHFGQSNWQYLDNRLPPSSKVWLYMIWGGFVTLMPLLLHFENIKAIICLILRIETLQVSPIYLTSAAGLLFFLTTEAILNLFANKILSSTQILQELLQIGLLMILFWLTPPLIGFAIYFVFWHSLTSIMDQIEFLKERRKSYSIAKYIKDTLPLTILALLSMGGGYYLLSGQGIAIDIGWIFVFISIITLPHVLLIELLYENQLKNKHYKS